MVVLLVVVTPDVVLSPRPGIVLASVKTHGAFGQVQVIGMFFVAATVRVAGCRLR